MYKTPSSVPGYVQLTDWFMNCNVTCLDRLHVVNDNQDLIKCLWSKSRNVVGISDEGIRSRSFCLRMRTRFSREIRYGIYVHDDFIGWINYTWHMENSIHSNHDGSTQDWFWPVKSRHQNHPPPFFTTLLRNYTKYTFTLRWSIYLSFLLITWRSLYFNNLIKGSRIFFKH